MNSPAIRLLGLSAHVASIALAVLFLLFALGEVFTPHGGSPAGPRDWIGIVLLTLACCAPMYAARRELAAASLSLGALALFCALVSYSNWPIVVVLAIPGMLHLAHALLTRPGHSLPAIG